MLKFKVCKGKLLLTDSPTIIATSMEALWSPVHALWILLLLINSSGNEYLKPIYYVCNKGMSQQGKASLWLAVYNDKQSYPQAVIHTCQLYPLYKHGSSIIKAKVCAPVTDSTSEPSFSKQHRWWQAWLRNCSKARVHPAYQCYWLAYCLVLLPSLLLLRVQPNLC